MAVMVNKNNSLLNRLEIGEKENNNKKKKIYKCGDGIIKSWEVK